MKKILVQQVEQLSRSFKSAPYPTFLSLLVMLVMFLGGCLITIIRKESDEKDEIIDAQKQTIDALNLEKFTRQDAEIKELKAFQKEINKLKK